MRMDLPGSTTASGGRMRSPSKRIQENFSKAQKFNFRMAEELGEAEGRNEQSRAIVQRILARQKSKKA